MLIVVVVVVVGMMTVLTVYSNCDFFFWSFPKLVKRNALVINLTDFLIYRSHKHRFVGREVGKKRTIFEQHVLCRWVGFCCACHIECFIYHRGVIRQRGHQLCVEWMKI